MISPFPPELTDSELKRLACLETSHAYAASVSVRADDGRIYSFATTHYLDGLHEANPTKDSDTPLERLVLRFTTGEVVLLGARLERIEEALAEGHLRRLRTISPRYAAVLKTGPLISSITVSRRNDL